MASLQSPVRLQVVTVSGTTLFAVASQYLGDATQWNRIAKLNGLVDPTIAGTATLQLPAVNASAGNGGILGL